MLSVMDKILHLKKIHIFSDLKISELAAIATIAKESSHQENEVVIREGDIGDAFFLIISGEVEVIKQYQEPDEFRLALMSAGDYFGEMALFEAMPRSATIKTTKSTQLLVLDKGEFEELVEEYPKIALNIAAVMSRRLRAVHEKILSKEKEQDNPSPE